MVIWPLCCLIYVHVCTVRAGVLPWYILYVTLLYCCCLIQDNATPVWVAAHNGHVEALSVLVSSGADFNAAEKVSYRNILACKITVYDVTEWSNTTV